MKAAPSDDSQLIPSPLSPHTPDFRVTAWAKQQMFQFIGYDASHDDGDAVACADCDTDGMFVVDAGENGSATLAANVG